MNEDRETFWDKPAIDNALFVSVALGSGLAYLFAAPSIWCGVGMSVIIYLLIQVGCAIYINKVPPPVYNKRGERIL